MNIPDNENKSGDASDNGEECHICTGVREGESGVFVGNGEEVPVLDCQGEGAL